MKKRITKQILAFLLLVGLICPAAPASTPVEAAKTNKTATSSRVVRIGKQLKISVKGKKVTYTSSNSTIASVSSLGIVTGKKAGKVQIIAKKAGKQVKSYQLTVKANDRKPSLSVAMDEVKLVSTSLKKKNSVMQFSAKVKNTAKKGTIRKIVYYYSITGKKSQAKVATGSAIVTAKKQVKLTVKNIRAGKTSKKVSCEGDVSGKLSNMKLQKIKLYTGDALYVYNAVKDTYSLKWGTADKTGPKFSGWIGKNSYCGEDTYRVCYTDRKKKYDFKKYVSAYDDRDGKVTFKVDTSGINWKKEGVYKIKYTAKDKAGNTTTAKAKVRVYKPQTAESIADEVLRSITKSSWSDEKKLRAIYKYVKKHCSYVDSNKHKDWRNTAVKGLRYESGDCFMYYAISRLLITRAGIPNIMVERYPAKTNGKHWWNLVYVRGGWYHFDTTPRLRPGKFCLVTDAQLRMYSTGYTFSFKKKYYPKRATKKISPNP